MADKGLLGRQRSAETYCLLHPAFQFFRAFTLPLSINLVPFYFWSHLPLLWRIPGLERALFDGQEEDMKPAKDSNYRDANNVVKETPTAPFNAAVPTQPLTKAQLSRAPPPASLTVPANIPKWGQKEQLAVKVQRPHDPTVLRRIHAVIQGVAEYGPDFEALLMEHEKFNEDYAFLFDSNVSSLTNIPHIPLPSFFICIRGSG